MLDLPKTRWKFEASLVKNERPNENGAKSMIEVPDGNCMYDSVIEVPVASSK